jgi:tetratricopeptide (TPR) repeat protein
VTEWQPWRVDLWERIARQYFLAKDWDSAIQYYQAAERVGSLSQESVLKLADAYESVGRLDNANAIWQGMIENNHPPVGVYQKALAYTWSQGDWAAAQQILLAWLGVDEKNAEANYRLGLLRFVSEPGSAEKLLLKATSQDESYLPKVSNLVKVLHEKPSETQKEYNLVKAGRALGGVGEWQMAKAAFEQAIRENAEYAEAWAYLGEAKQQLNEGGMRELKQAVALDPVSIASQALLALYYRRLGNPDLALMYLHEIALLEPDQAVWHVELGNTLAEMGDLARAGEEYQKAVELEPDQAQWWYQQAVFSLTNSIDVAGLALPAARKALQLQPQDVRYKDLLGWVLFTLGDRRSAQRFFDEALRNESNYAMAYLHLGQLYLDEGKSELAYTNLKQAERYAGADGEIRFLSKRLLERYFGSTQ